MFLRDRGTRSAQNEAENGEPVKMYDSHEIPPYPTIPLDILYGNVHINLHKGMARHEENHNVMVCSRTDHRWIMFTFLDDNKKELSDRVIKSVRYTINDVNEENKRDQMRVDTDK